MLCWLSVLPESVQVIVQLFQDATFKLQLYTFMAITDADKREKYEEGEKSRIIS